MNMCWVTGWGSNETWYTVLRLGLTKSSNFWIRHFERRSQLCVYQVLQMILTNSQIWACTHSCGSNNMGDLTEIYEIKKLNQGLPGGPVVKYLPPNVGDMSLIPGVELRFPHTSGQLCLLYFCFCFLTTQDVTNTSFSLSCTLTVR